MRTHIDDFGTGASPLRLLHRFPGDAIKISRALVAGIGHDAGAFEIVRAVVGLAHNLGLEVIADGVEKREQLDYLKVLGCEFAQGFHISAPLTRRGGAGAAGAAAPAPALSSAARSARGGRRSRSVDVVAVEARRARRAGRRPPGRGGRARSRRRASRAGPRGGRRRRRRRRRGGRSRLATVVDAVVVAVVSPSTSRTCPRTCRARTRRSARGRPCPLVQARALLMELGLGALGLGLLGAIRARCSASAAWRSRCIGLGTMLVGHALAALSGARARASGLGLARACAAARKRARAMMIRATTTMAMIAPVVIGIPPFRWG